MKTKKAKPSPNKPAKSSSRKRDEDNIIPARPSEERSTGTSILQFRATDTSKKVRSGIERQFTKFDEAREYIKTLVNGHDLDKSSSDGTVCTFGPIEIYSNYDVRLVIKGKAPTKPLPEIIREIKTTFKTSSGAYKEKAEDISKEAKSETPDESDSDGEDDAPKDSGDTVVLKQICQELKLEPRIARAILRKVSKSGKVPRETAGARYRWSKADALKVKAILAGGK